MKRLKRANRIYRKTSNGFPIWKGFVVCAEPILFDKKKNLIRIEYELFLYSKWKKDMYPNNAEHKADKRGYITHLGKLINKRIPEGIMRISVKNNPMIAFLSKISDIEGVCFE